MNAVLTATDMMPVIWIMGRPGSGKSVLSQDVQSRIPQESRPVILDADHMRGGPMMDLGYSDADRRENITRLALFADLLVRRGTVPIVCAVTPHVGLRHIARIHCDPMLVCLTGRQRPLWKGTEYQTAETADVMINMGQVTVHDAGTAVLEAYEQAAKARWGGYQT